MRYMFKSVYTPNDPISDRRRVKCIVETTEGAMDALLLAISKMEMGALRDECVREYLDGSRDEDTSDGWGWSISRNSGSYYFEWSPFDTETPVTRDSVCELLESQADKEGISLHEKLVRVMGRVFWLYVEQQSLNDLRQAVHEMQVVGETFMVGPKPFKNMTVWELLEEFMSGENGVVPYSRVVHDELRSEQPFGIDALKKTLEEL